jgi:hypothetical protein
MGLGTAQRNLSNRDSRGRAELRWSAGGADDGDGRRRARPRAALSLVAAGEFGRRALSRAPTFTKDPDEAKRIAEDGGAGVRRPRRRQRSSEEPSQRRPARLNCRLRAQSVTRRFPP